MGKEELLRIICQNIYNHGWALQDSAFFAVTQEQRQGAEWTLDKILRGTGHDSMSIINVIREDNK